MINERLEILVQQGLIQSEQQHWIRQMRELLISRFHIKETALGWDAFTMHLAMMFHRMNSRETITACDQGIISQCQQQLEYNQAKKIVVLMEKAVGNQFPEVEYPYLYLHVCTLLQEVE